MRSMVGIEKRKQRHLTLSLEEDVQSAVDISQVGLTRVLA